MIDLKVFSKFFLAIFIVLTVINVYQLAAPQIQNSIQERGWGVSAVDTTIVGFGLEVSTPEVAVEWIGDENKQIRFLETFIIPGITDLPFIFGFVALALWLTRIMWNNWTALPAILTITLLWTVGFYGLYVIWKLILIQLMISRAEALGMSAEQILNIREAIMIESRSLPTYKFSLGFGIVGFLLLMWDHYTKDE